jgi:ABC-type polysaccharide/polyol phosphate export permease
MGTGSATLRPLPLALSLATFLAISYIGCLLFALIVPDRGLHVVWLQLYPAFSWTWYGVLIGFGETVIYGFVAGLIYAPIYNYFNDR